jgi:hypothetical protein
MSCTEESLTNDSFDISNIKYLSGRKPKYSLEELKEKLAQLPAKN